MLDADALMRAAEAQTGLSDWGDPTLPARFRLFVSKFNEVGMRPGRRPRPGPATNS
jgi:hypothetical protein